MTILIAAILLMGYALLPYAIYWYGTKYGKKQNKLKPLLAFPPISVVMSAYNEEANIERRLKNLKDCNYPDLEVIFVDDKSSDETVKLAERWLRQLKFNHRLLLNDERLGTSGSYNRAIKQASRDIIVVTDADVIFDENALHKLITRLMSSEYIGGVTGDLQPAPNSSKTTQRESHYRSIYGKMCDWESAIDSTFNFNGALMAFKTKAVHGVNQKNGADDANIAFEVINNGFRSVYELEAVVYEEIPESSKVQYAQKVRRARGLIETIITNGERLFQTNKPRPVAGFFMLRAWMILMSPSLLFLSASLFFISSLEHSLIAAILFVIILVLLSTTIPPTSSFIFNQIYLMVGLFSRGRDAQIWDSTTSMQKVEK